MRSFSSSRPHERTTAHRGDAQDSRVARKYFYVQLHYKELAFDISTGEEHVRGDFRNYLWQAYTPDGYKAKFRREDALARIHAQGVYFQGGAMRTDQFSIEKLEKLCAVLEDAE